MRERHGANLHNLESIEAGEYGLNRISCFVASFLEVIAVAGLLLISWCVMGAAGFRVLGSFVSSFERARSAANMRPPCLVYLSTRKRPVSPSLLSYPSCAPSLDVSPRFGFDPASKRHGGVLWCLKSAIIPVDLDLALISAREQTSLYLVPGSGCVRALTRHESRLNCRAAVYG